MIKIIYFYLLSIIFVLIIVKSNQVISSSNPQYVYELQKENFHQITHLPDNQQSFFIQQQWIILYYQNNCKFCLLVFEIFSKINPIDLELKFRKGSIDCTTNNKICQNYGIHKHPTILYFKNSIAYEYQQKEIPTIKLFNKFILLAQNGIGINYDIRKQKQLLTRLAYLINSMEGFQVIMITIISSLGIILIIILCCQVLGKILFNLRKKKKVFVIDQSDQTNLMEIQQNPQNQK